MNGDSNDSDPKAETVLFKAAAIPTVSGAEPGSPPPAEPPIAPPAIERVAEFVIRGKLGQGGFGTVFLAYDTVLQREVAIKIPHRFIAHGEETTADYLREARAVASLDHPHILPVYQASSTPEVSFYIVTKLIDGTTLGEWYRQSHPAFSQIAEMVATIADALAYAHSKGVVHRDVKPGNILVDREGRPYVADFGLATREFDPDSEPAYAGTPSYMSPEQARGEGHRVDGRSDIFSLGVVFYQLLVGTRPFPGFQLPGESMTFNYSEPEHPCVHNPAVPKELARICLCALAVSVTDRYQSAGDMATDLQEFLKSPQGQSQEVTVVYTPQVDLAKPISGIASTTVYRPSDTRVSPIVPKGLRPFEAGDAEFFLRLLPGPYDRGGLPASLRFWKTRLESTHFEETFSVGVVYGPSGCGKTSMFRAGLLPRLSDAVIPLYVEASASETERSIATAISTAISIPPRPGNRQPGDDASADLVHIFTWLRRHSRRKVVLCIDQFEQWLFNHPSALERSALAQALRQCDGIHLQCVLMVRDDFWMGISRLMQALDLTISENHNAAAVDLFDKRHARNVLAMFGTAFGRLPEKEQSLSPKQDQFLDAAIEYLAIDGRVICVQLALLAEMMKQRDWNDSSLLKQDGGAGLGVHFLEQTFDLETSQRRHRRHTEGAQRVLRRLLPEPGVKIKGAIQSESELLQASGYTDVADFRELIRLLDSELHLITPTDRNDFDSLTPSSVAASRTMSETGYQLTHDFLIAAIRRWLELRQLGTSVGQAQLKLESFTDLYRARPSRHSLPSLLEYLSIRFRIRPSAWNEPQQRMMQASRDLHLRSTGKWMSLLVVVVVMAQLGWNWISREQARQLQQARVQRQLVATWPDAISQAGVLRQEGPGVVDSLRSHLVQSDLPLSKRVRAALVLSPTEPTAREVLLEYLKTAPLQELVLVCKSEPLPRLVDVEQVKSLWESKQGDASQQLRLACLIAQHESTQPVLLAQSSRVVQLLLGENPVQESAWMDGFEPIGEKLVPTLVSTLEGIATESSGSVLNAANLIARFARKRPDLLADLISKSGPTAFRVLVNSLQGNPAGPDALHVALKTARAPLLPEQHWLPDADGIDWWNEPSQSSNLPPRALAPELAKQIRDAGGVMTGDFALVQSIDSQAFESLTAKLASAGYRVASLCPYPQGGKLQCMATWKRDGRKSVYTMNSTAAELKQLQADYEKQRYFADDIVAYSVDENLTSLFACVWTTTPPLPIVAESQMYVDVSLEDHQTQGWEPLLKRGFLPRANILTSDQGDRAGFTSVRWRLKKVVDFTDQWNQTSEEFDKVCQWSTGCLLVHSRWGVRPRRESDQGLSVLWWNGLPFESQWLPYQSLEGHRGACETIQAQGYRPYSIHARLAGDGERPQFSSTWWRPLENLASRSQSIRSQTRLILALHELGDHRALLEVMSSPTNAEQRAAVVDGCSRYGIRPLWLVEQLCDAKDLFLRRAAAHALALYRPGPLTEEAQQLLTGHGPSTLLATEDAGLRSAILALNRAWTVALPPWPTTATASEFQTSAKQRMVILTPPEVIWLGSTPNEPGRDSPTELKIPVRWNRQFAVSAHEVTVQEFREFRESYDCPLDYCPTPDCPVTTVNWFEAARYCRWLSEREKIPESEMCYPPIPEIVPGMKFKEGFLERTGYRLPTEAEWEFAAHGGYDLGRHFGFAPELLDHFAWTAQNSEYRCHPVESLLPNDYGLFDMLGNAMEWCQDRKGNRPWPSIAAELEPGTNFTSIADMDEIVTRGGAVLYQPLDSRAGHYDWHYANSNPVYLSFRIAKTVRKK